MLTYKFMNSKDVEIEEPLCHEYIISRYSAQILNTGVKYAIIILNTVIRYAVIFVINKVG